MNQNSIVKAFLDPEIYDHSVGSIQLIETHISWVFLTGDFAYKIKKPVDFGFLDFTDIDKRQYYCQQELVLNKRLAPEIYLDVIPVTKLDNQISLNGEGTIIEYAIKMRQFDQHCLFDKLLNNQNISLSHINQLADTVAKFHHEISNTPPNNNFGAAQQVVIPVEHNFIILKDVLNNPEDLELVNSLNEKMHVLYKQIYPALEQRKQQAHICECHGDLHLGNIAFINNQVLLFDGIEFNDSFRWIDTMSDIAFLIMDLEDHDQTVFANHFLNHYLEKTGDYSGLSVLKFYQFYRATVRAKVAGLRLEQQSDSPDFKETINQLRKYLTLANTYVKPKNTFLAISYGISGSGKSWVSSRLADLLGAIQLRSDLERKRNFSKNNCDMYSQSVTDKTYTLLKKLSLDILNSGYPVIVDATFLDKEKRNIFEQLAKQLAIPFYILSCTASQNIITQRINSREKQHDNISDADVTVMQNQLSNLEPLDNKEKQYEILINTSELKDCADIAKQIKY